MIYIIIKYIWHEEPEKIKTFDTVKAFNKMPLIFRGNKTQSEQDDFELSNFEKKKQEGLVLKYWKE